MPSSPQSLKDLLRNTVKKNHIAEQVTKAMIVEACNNWLTTILPPSRKNDAKATSVRGSTIEIACMNGAVAQHILSREEQCLAHLSQTIVNSTVDQIRTKIVNKFTSSEIM